VLLRVLGSVEVLSSDGQPVRLGGPKERALLAALAVHVGRVVAEDALVDAIWRDQPPPSALPTLRSYVSRLRRALEGQTDVVVETRPPGYRLRVAPGCLDAAEAESLLGRARQAMSEGRPSPAVEDLTRAGALWLGPSLGEFASEPFALAEVNRLDELRIVITEERLEGELRLGRHREALPDVEALASDHPLRERLWALRVLALYRSGNQAEALRAYQLLRRHLSEELGLEPTPTLRALEAAVLAQDPELDWVPVEPVNDPDPEEGRGPEAALHNVPARLSSFVGRRVEVAEIAGLLRRERLVTLIGSPGVGKTRLALAVAAEVRPSQLEGTWLVELAPVSEPALIAQTLASVLSIRERPGVDVVDTLVAELADSRLLLVLDNCEHLIDGCGRLARRLLEACPGLVMLVTSREPLGVDGECVRRIDPLEVPPAASEAYASLVAHDAVRLFAERGASTQAGWALDEATAPLVGEICRRLEGIPLAIELAAARLELLSLPEIVGQLEQRFRLLRSPARAAPSFHSSLLATLDWSHNLLSGAEAALLRRLSVFAGGCTLDAVEAVGSGGEVVRDDVMELLGALVRKSLVFTDRQHHQTRYRILDAVRDYEAGKLAEAGERSAVSAEHCAWALDLAVRAEASSASGAGTGWLERLEAEQDNFRAANDWATAEGRADIRLRFAGALASFWWLQGHVREALQVLESALAAGREEAPELRARALWAVAYIVGSSGDVATALPLARQSLALAEVCGDTVTSGRSRNLLGLLSMYRSPVEALSLLEVDVGVARGQGDDRLLASTLCTLGTALLLVGDARSAQVHLTESLEIATRHGNRSFAATVLGALGQAAIALGDHLTADTLLHQALALALELSERGEAAVVRSLLGDLARHRGDHDQARSYLDQALEAARTLGRPYLVARCLCFLGRVALAEADLAEARDRFDESLAMARGLGIPYLVARCLLGLGEISAQEDADEATTGAVFEEALAVASAAGDRQATATATSALAEVALRRGEPERARSMAAEALGVQDEIGDLAGIARTLETAATLLGPGPNGLRLAAAADRLRRSGGYARAVIASRGPQPAPADPSASAGAVGAVLSTAEAVALATALLSGAVPLT